LSEEVRLEVAGRVAVVTIDRPHSRNAIGLATAGQLEEVIGQVERSDVSVLVITGAGDRAFVSGGDLKELEQVRTVKGGVTLARQMRSVLDQLAGLPCPVIAALNGHALGGGAEVAVAADIRVAAHDARIGFSQATLGLMPAWGGVERLARLVGRSRALLLLSSGRLLSAEQARAFGLVDEVFPRADFGEGWRQLAAEIALPPSGVPRSIKKLVSRVAPALDPETEAEAVAAFAALWADPEHWRMAAEADLRRRSARDGGA
jgi:enoyl-CoA hydratase/carnithine racemase